MPIRQRKVAAGCANERAVLLTDVLVSLHRWVTLIELISSARERWGSSYGGIAAT